MNMILQTWGSTTVEALQNVWSGFIGFIPDLIGAFIVLVVGWIFAIALGKIATQILRAFRLDQVTEKVGLKSGLEKAGYEFDVSEAGGWLVKWFFVIVFVMAGTELLGLESVSNFLKDDVVSYVPQVIAAAAILLIGIVLAQWLAKVVRGSVQAAELRSPGLLAGVTRWIVYIFTVFTALYQLGVGRAIINTLITGFVALLAIAGGLAFGLGGRDMAADLLNEVKEEIKK